MRQQYRSFWALMLQQPGLLLSLSYLLVSLLGIFFTWSMYHKLGVDYLQFAEITDFLMAVLREPLTLLLAASAVLVTFLLHWMLIREQRYFSVNQPKNWFSRTYKLLSDWSYSNIVALEIVACLLYCFVFVSLYGEWKSAQLRAGHGNQVSIQLTDENQPLQRILLGDSSRYLFLFDSAAGHVEAIPHENILKLTMVVSSAPQSPEQAPPKTLPATKSQKPEAETEPKSKQP